MTTTSTAPSTGRIAAAFLGELENEAKVTRSVLERVPADKFDYKPHEKSMTFGRLASHIAEMFGWTEVTLKQDGLDFATMDYKPFEPQSTEELLQLLDEKVAGARRSIAETSDETFMQPWTMRNGDQVYMTMPKVAVLRGIVMNHIIHHRGQLSVYLRLNDIPVPSIYGPSADEGAM
ncbi:MAG: DinB family protein [Pyrinomonadaceae bacterium]